MKPHGWFPGGKALLAAAVMWLLLAGIALYYAWPWFPDTVPGWVIFVLLSPPTLLFMEWLGKKVMPPAKATAWTGRHERTRISSLLAFLVRMLVLMTIFFGLVIVIGASFQKS